MTALLQLGVAMWTYLSLSYCSLHEETGAAANKIKFYCKYEKNLLQILLRRQDKISLPGCVVGCGFVGVVLLTSAISCSSFAFNSFTSSATRESWCRLQWQLQLLTGSLSQRFAGIGVWFFLAFTDEYFATLIANRTTVSRRKSNDESILKSNICAS